MMAERSGSKGTGTGGMSSAKETPANSGQGLDKPGVLDSKGAIGSAFTGKL